MSEIRYLSLADVLALHALTMEKFGEPPAALRDEGLLESAVMRPKMVAYYSAVDIIGQCALLTVAISQAQAFLDGNKRTAFAACDVFLRLNGLAFVGEPLEIAMQIEEVARRTVSLDEATGRFEQWLRGQVGHRESA